MKQLAILHTESSPNWGGQEIRVFEELKVMKARGHRTGIVTPEGSPLARACREAGIEVHGMTFQKARIAADILALRALCRRIRPDVLNPHSSRDSWVAVVAGRWAGVPLIIRSRHIEVDYPKAWLSRYSFTGLPHHVITTSERIRQRLIDELGVPFQNIDTVATGIDLVRYRHGHAGTVRRELGFGPEVRLVGMISVLRSWKGHGDFLDAAKILLAGGAAGTFRFVIAGEGPQRAEIERRLQEPGLAGRVTLLGHRSDVREVLGDLNALVLPSHGKEGIPQIVLQAHAMQVPVVATRVGGIPEVVDDGRTGRLVSPRDPAALAAALDETLSRHELSATMARAARAHVERFHSLAAMAEHLEAIYARHLGA